MKLRGKPAVSIAAIAIVLFLMLTAKVNYSLTDQGVLVEYRYAALLPQVQKLIAYDAIQSTEVLQQLPSRRKIVGFESFGRLLIGSYRSDAIGEFQAYIQNTRIPQLLIKASDKTYVISPRE
ncbi:MAG: PH domain-containing protein, partial [Bacillota bacterium]